MNFDVNTFNVPLYDEILGRGLSNGLGNRGGKMCIEAAICTVLDLPHGDDPKCVANCVRLFKINLNDKSWSSPQARAEGLRDLGLAQLGSLGVIDDKIFVKRLSEEIIGVLIPALFEELYSGKFVELVATCKQEKSQQSAINLDAAAYAAAAYAAADAYAAAYAAANAAAYAAADANAAYAAAAADAAAYAAAAADAAAYADAAADAAAYAAADAYAAAYAADADKYLKLAAKIALDILIELKSPGCQLLGTR